MTEVYPGIYSHYLNKLANLTRRIATDGKYILYGNHGVGSNLLFEALPVPRLSIHSKIKNANGGCVIKERKNGTKARQKPHWKNTESYSSISSTRGTQRCEVSSRGPA